MMRVAGDYQQAKGMGSVCMLRRLIHQMDKPFYIFDQIFAPKTRTHAFTLTHSHHSIQYSVLYTIFQWGVQHFSSGANHNIYTHINEHRQLV